MDSLPTLVIGPSHLRSLLLTKVLIPGGDPYPHPFLWLRNTEVLRLINVYTETIHYMA